MIKIQIQGSPCTHWSIAQTKNRETHAEGLGWELFKNVLYAKEKFQPDVFLYENNKSASAEIKDQIRQSLGVGENGMQYIEINSALVSAQNRQRFYVHNCGDIGQPKDRGILLKDILISGEDLTSNDKSYCLTATYDGAIPSNTIERHQMSMVADEVKPLSEAEMDYMIRDHQDRRWNFMNKPGQEEKSKCITANIAKGVPYNILAEPVCVRQIGRNPENTHDRTVGVPTTQVFEARIDGKTGTITTVTKDNLVAEPIQVGAFPRPNGDISHSRGFRIYGDDGKSVTLIGNGGGAGAKTGLYAIPAMPVKEATAQGYTEINPGECVDLQYPHSPTSRGRRMDEKSNSLQTSNEFYEYIGTTEMPIYEVKDGQITIKGRQYPIKLVDGYYIIRKLTVAECCRLQTMPDDYCRAVSNSQAYKGLGNGWTAEVIRHILNGALKDVPRDEEIVVLSLYDGIGTGRYVLDQMGFTNVRYYAYEIDKYAIKIATSNFPDIIECGDAFQVREDDWRPPT